MKENQVILKKRERFFLEDKFYLISKGSVEVGNNINLEDINTNSKKGGVDIVASVGQAWEIGVTGTIADKLDKKVVTSSAIVV